MRVLIVDDEEAIRKSLQRILDYEGYESILAGSAEEAIRADPGATTFSFAARSVPMRSESSPTFRAQMVG